MDVKEQFATYPFDTDEAFQDGLLSILNSSEDSVDRDELILKAKVYYFSTITGQNLSWEEVKPTGAGEQYKRGFESHESQHPVEDTVKQEAPPNSDLQSMNATTDDAEPKVLSFAEITALIESNQTHLIPNNDIIPGGINEQKPSQSREKPRKKPWEKDLTNINSTGPA